MTERRRAAIAMALLAAWFLAFTGARPLNVPDEGRYAEVAREMAVSGDFTTPRLDGVPFLDKPPFFYWLEALSFRAFGVHVWSARLVPALLGALGCLLVLLAGARLHGWRAGLLGAVVLAANPFYFGASLYVNHDLAVAVAVSAALLAFAVSARASGRRRWAWLLAGSACAGVALLTKGLIGVLFPFGIAGLWAVALRRWDRLPRYALAILLSLLVAVPWFVAASAANPDLLHYFFVTQHFERFAGRGFNNPMGPGFYPVLIAVAFLPWSPLLPAAWSRGVAAFRRDPEDGRGDLLLVLWPAVVVVFFSIPASKIAGYVLPALPPLAMAVGRWWDEALGSGGDGRPRSLLASGAGMALLALALAAAPFLPAFRVLIPARAALPIAATGLGALAAAIAALLAWRGGRLGGAFSAHVAFAAVVSAGLILAVPAVVRDGTRPLAERLRPLLRDGDVVVNYGRYFYDLPLYLDRREHIVVVDDWGDPQIPRCDNWRRELLLGRGWSVDSEAWLVHPRQLAPLCLGGGRCYVLVREERAAEVEALLPLVPIARHEGTLLLGTPSEFTDAAGPSR